MIYLNPQTTDHPIMSRRTSCGNEFVLDMKSLLNEDFNLNIFVRKVKKKRVIFLRTSFENTIANVFIHWYKI
jgi:hypothetical protein